MTTTVDLPVGGTTQGLLAQASPLPEGWERGVEFLSRSCLDPERVGPCPLEDPSDTSTPSAAHFTAIQLRQGVECSARSRLDVAAKAREALAITAEYLLGQEMMDGLASGTNPSLADATLVATDCTTVAEAIGCLEAAGAVALKGRLLTIHVPPGLSVHLPDTIRMEGGRLLTPYGSRVVVSPGYSGASVYATGEVFAGANIHDANAGVSKDSNREVGWADAAGLVCFDPCWIGEAETTITCTPPESPGEEERQ